jgi:hypothetical protein
MTLEFSIFEKSSNIKLHENIFPHYLINGTVFLGGGGELLNTKCVFCFSLKLLSKAFLILKGNERDTIKNVYWSSCTVPSSLVRF